MLNRQMFGRKKLVTQHTMRPTMNFQNQLFPTKLKTPMVEMFFTKN
jgi:hypothetical protein